MVPTETDCFFIDATVDDFAPRMSRRSTTYACPSPPQIDIATPFSEATTLIYEATTVFSETFGEVSAIYSTPNASKASDELVDLARNV